MVVIHFIHNNNVVLTQLLQQVPSVDENIKIKGRKGKVVSVKEIEENKFQVQVTLEEIIKKQLTLLDNKKKNKFHKLVFNYQQSI